MGFSYWFRVGMMVVTLVGVLMIMHKLQNPGSTNGLFKFFGAGPSHLASVNLCPTRVTRLEAGKVSVFQEGLDWYRSNDSGKQHLDPVAVEKWFSRHCAQKGQKVSASADVKEALRVFFVSGEPQVLLKSASGEFEWMGQPFSSTQMDRALAELDDLPPAAVH